MKDTPDLKEIVRICAINAGSIAWFLTSATCDTFEALFDRILIYEELVRAGGIEKTRSGASVHFVDDVFATNDYNNRGRDRHDKSRYNKGGGNASSSGEPSRRQWRDPKDYSFELKDTERWFELMLKEGQITPLTPKEPVRPEDKKLANYCRFHQRVDHPTSICRHLREIIQDAFEKGLLKYEDKGKTAANVMMVSHGPLCDQIQDASDAEDEPSPVTDVVAYEVASTEVNQAESRSDGPTEHGTPSFRMGELPTLPQRHGAQVRLLCSFGGRIAVHGEELRYINGETRLVVIDRESSYADLVARVKSLFAVNGKFCIKNQLPGEKPDCLITIASDEEFWNVLAEHEHAADSSSPVRVRLFILQDEASPPTGAMLGATKAKKKVAESYECASVGGSVESNTRRGRRRNRHRRGRKRQQSVRSSSNAPHTHVIRVTEKMTRHSPEKFHGHRSSPPSDTHKSLPARKGSP